MELHRPRRGRRSTLRLNQDPVPQVAWQQPTRLRNRIVHGYWSIDMDVLHTTATEQLPEFVAALHLVLDNLDEASKL
jgi:uncharacterized protein with HEPN domain